MASAKVTFTLDGETVQRIRKLAEQQRKPQSLIVREAVAQYAGRDVKLSPEERDRKLAIIREILARPPQPGDKTAEDVDRELAEIRRSRNEGWSRPTD